MRTILVATVVAVMPLPAAEQKDPLEPPTGSRFYQDVAWSPDGAWLAYSRYEPDPGAADYQPDKWSVVVARTDGTDERLVAANAQWVSWSRDGDRLAFASPREGDWDLYSIDLDGSNLTRLTFDAANERAPSWSPDGKTIAFTSDRDGNSEIYLLPVDGKEGPRRLTSNPADDHNPKWSPNGERLTFYRAVEGGAADQVYEIGTDGSGELRLTDDEHLNIFPTYLPDGRLAWTRKQTDGNREGLVVFDPDSAAVTPVGPDGVFFGRWSPDGERVALIAGSWPKAAVYVMFADGSIRKILN